MPINPVKPDIAPVTGSDGAVTDPGFLRYPSERATTVLIVYPFLQKHFRTGVLTGAIKG